MNRLLKTLSPRLLLPAIIAAAVFTSCSFSDTDVVEAPSGPFYIQDVSGRQWDITYAVITYAWDPKHFSIGKGPYTRPPIVEPEMISPGERDYPPDDATVQVLAADVGGERRAYAIRDIMRNEVLDDTIRETHITVAY